MADIMAFEGYAEAGYTRVNVDDCWAQHRRDPATNRLLPDPNRFHSAIPGLAKYVGGL